MTITRTSAVAAAVFAVSLVVSGCSAIPAFIQAQDNAVANAGGCPPSALAGFKAGYLESTKGTDAADATISEIKSSEFQLPEIGDDYLATGCYFRVEFSTSETDIVLDEAILPQGGDAKSEIGSRLVDAGFDAGDTADSYSSAADGRNVSLIDQFDEAMLTEMGGAYADGVVVVTVYTIG